MTLALLAAASACAPAPLPDYGARAVGKRSEAVVVAYYADRELLRTCAGTLLSTNVVVAPAHCADGSTRATVSAANAARTRTSVSRMYTYDWTSADPAMDARTRHDVALLVLRRPVEKTRLAKVQRQPAGSGIKVVQIGRGRGRAGSLLSISRPLVLGAAHGRGAPTRVAVESSRVTARGGALYRVSSDRDERVIVGLVIGHGQRSGAGVIVPLADATIQSWIRAVVKTEKGHADYTTPSAPSSVRILAEGDEGGESTPEPATEQVDDEGANDAAPAEPPSSPETEESPPASTSEDPVIDAPETAPEPSGTEPTTPQTPQQDPTEGSPAAPASDDPVVLTGGTEEEPSPGGTAPAPPTTDPSGYDDARAAGTEAPASAPADTPADDTKSTPNDTAPPYPGSIAGVGALRSPATDEQTTLHPSGNAVTVALPGDKAFADDGTLAKKYEGTANVYNSHGMPGQLLGGVPAETMQKFLADDKPLIVASCFSAAPMTGGSTIRRVASAYGDDPGVASRIYGCSGYASGDSSGLGCTGTWLDGNGRAVPPAERGRLNLNQYQCSTNTFDSAGKPVWSDCASND